MGINVQCRKHSRCSSGKSMRLHKPLLLFDSPNARYRPCATPFRNPLNPTHYTPALYIESHPYLVSNPASLYRSICTPWNRNTSINCTHHYSPIEKVQHSTPEIRKPRYRHLHHAFIGLLIMQFYNTSQPVSAGVHNAYQISKCNISILEVS
jgi:hypothetical protein